MMTNTKIKVHVVPSPGNFPKHGGVREHLLQLYNCIGESNKVALAPSADLASVIHVESSYTSNGRRPDIYTCHGVLL